MKSTFKLTGLADYITLTNAMFGTLSIFFLILAVDDTLSDPYSEGLATKYIWASMLCIFLSAVGDIIDGPVARRYSKQKLLGGSLDIMSDCLSFCVAPALMMFIMFGRWGEATPLWTISLGIAGFWIIATGMLRLARFQHEEGSNLPYFHGLSSPGNAMVLMSAAGFIWLQPLLNVGPDLKNAEICLGEGIDYACHATPGLDIVILPIMFISGVIDDLRTSFVETQRWIGHEIVHHPNDLSPHRYHLGIDSNRRFRCKSRTWWRYRSCRLAVLLIGSARHLLHCQATTTRSCA